MVKDFHFPEEIKNLLGPLRNPRYWEILEILINNNNKIPYTELRKKLQMSDKQKGVLNYYLNELEKGGWLRNYTEPGNEITDKYSSFYSVTKFGQKVIEGILQAMNKASYPDPLIEYAKFVSDIPKIATKTVPTTRNKKITATSVVPNAKFDIISALSNFGLSEIDVTVYLGLLQLGSVSVGTLSSKLGLDRGKTYRSLNTLRNLGMISTTFSNPTICKVIEPKEGIMQIIERRESETNTLRQLSSVIVNELERMKNVGSEVTEIASFSIIQDTANIYARIGQFLQKSKGIVYIIAPIGDILRMIQTSIPEKISLCKENGCTVRLYTDILNTDLIPLIRKLNATEIRVGRTPSKSRMLVSIDELILSASFDESVISDEKDSILITDSKEMIENMLSLCGHLWRKGKEITIASSNRVKY